MGTKTFQFQFFDSLLSLDDHHSTRLIKLIANFPVKTANYTEHRTVSALSMEISDKIKTKATHDNIELYPVINLNLLYTT